MNHETRLTERDENFSDLSLDRLIDGEMSPEEQRRLLEQLELDPNGWRRVGLAFLEAQALRRSCRELVAPTVSAGLPLVMTSTPPRTRVRLVTSAVALLLAFTLGGMTGRMWSPPPAAVVTAPAVDALATPKVETPAQPINAVPVAFQYGDGTTTEPVSTPVVDASSPEAQAWLLSAQSPGVPERIQELLRRQGQKLEERQEWVEIELADGRRGYMPVQQWTVAPVSVADFR
ncbi:MAG TPA: hypothetical protein VFG20_10120 [Planctomycetaceae bacterium]|nr:hypothetical protein [Planctomycetaceae bacterium]